METQNQRDENKKRSLECISRINEVEGFSPESLKEDMMVGDTAKPMLSLQYKKAWFRMKYPSGNDGADGKLCDVPCQSTSISK